MMMTTSRWWLVATFPLLISGCVLKGVMLEDGGDELGEDETDEGEAGGEWGSSVGEDEGETMGETGEPMPSDPLECLSFGSNLDGTTTPPDWALYPDYDVECGAGFGHEEVRFGAIEWTSTLTAAELGVPALTGGLVGALTDGGVLVVADTKGGVPLLIRMSSSGEIVWTKVMDLLGEGTSIDLVEMEPGADTFVLGMTTVEGPLLAAIDGDGSLLWTHVADDGGMLGSVARTSQGFAYSSIQDLQDTTIVSLDEDGQQLWSKSTPVERGWRLAWLPDDDVLVGSTDTFARHDTSGNEQALSTWSQNWLSLALTRCEGFLAATGAAVSVFEPGDPQDAVLSLYTGDNADLWTEWTKRYRRATSWVETGSPADPSSESLEVVWRIVAVDDGVVMLGVESAGPLDVWTPFLIHVDTQGQVQGIDRLFWAGEPKHGAAGPDDGLFVVLGQPYALVFEEGQPEPPLETWAQLHVRKYRL